MLIILLDMQVLIQVRRSLAPRADTKPPKSAGRTRTWRPRFRSHMELAKCLRLHHHDGKRPLLTSLRQCLARRLHHVKDKPNPIVYCVQCESVPSQELNSRMGSQLLPSNVGSPLYLVFFILNAGTFIFGLRQAIRTFHYARCQHVLSITEHLLVMLLSLSRGTMVMLCSTHPLYRFSRFGLLFIFKSTLELCAAHSQRRVADFVHFFVLVHHFRMVCFVC